MDEPSISERVAENSWAKIVTRYLMPLVIVVAGYLAMAQLTDLKDSASSVSKDVSKIDRHVSDISAAVKVLSETVHNNRMWSDDMSSRLDKGIEKLGQRIDVLETARREAIAR